MAVANSHVTLDVDFSALGSFLKRAHCDLRAQLGRVQPLDPHKL